MSPSAMLYIVNPSAPALGSAAFEDVTQVAKVLVHLPGLESLVFLP
jgi:hypothetical protein